LEREREANPRLVPEINAAISHLMQTPADPPKGPELRTSQQKAKRMPVDDYTRVRNRALASRSPRRDTFVDFLHASTVTGLRPDEWPSVRFTRSTIPGFVWEMTVRNAK